MLVARPRESQVSMIPKNGDSQCISCFAAHGSAKRAASTTYAAYRAVVLPTGQLYRRVDPPTGQLHCGDRVDAR